MRQMISDDARRSAARLLNRVLRYGIVGFVISIVYSLTIVLVVSQFDTLSATQASVLAFAVVLPMSYFAHRRVTFFDATPDPFQPLRYAVTTVATFLVAIVGMYLVTDVFGRSYLVGIALNWALIPASNFLIYVAWVFRLETRKADATLPARASEAMEKT